MIRQSGLFVLIVYSLRDIEFRQEESCAWCWIRIKMGTTEWSVWAISHTQHTSGRPHDNSLESCAYIDTDFFVCVRIAYTRKSHWLYVIFFFYSNTAQIWHLYNDAWLDSFASLNIFLWSKSIYLYVLSSMRWVRSRFEKRSSFERPFTLRISNA